VVVAVLGFLVSMPAFATTVTAVKGSVLINRGDGFRPVTGTAPVKVGDSLMVRPGGNARIVYSDGCPVSINPGEVVTIGAESPCTAYAQAAPPGAPGGAPGDQDGPNFGVLVVGAAGVAVIITAILAAQERGASPGTRPASP
jgi:hypothetical protein